MPIICWTVVHHAAAPVAHALGHAAHTVRAIGPHLHHVARAPGPRTWVQVVCRFVPAAALGGGLLITPPAASPPAVPPPVSVIAPPLAELSPWSWPEPAPTGAYAPVAPSVDKVPESSAASLLIPGGAALLLIRLHRARRIGTSGTP